MHFTAKAIFPLLFVVFYFPACETLDVAFPSGNGPQQTQESKPGPPDHAPAHGYRRKHPKDNVQLSYDAPSGVYVVIGYANHFFSGDLYYRIGGSNWEISSGINGPWTSTSDSNIPPGLKNKKAKNPGKGKGKGKK